MNPETTEMNPMVEFMPLEEALAIKVVTISKKIFDQLPEIAARPDEYQTFFLSKTIVGCVGHYFVFKDIETGRLEKMIYRDVALIYSEIIPEADHKVFNKANAYAQVQEWADTHQMFTK